MRNDHTFSRRAVIAGFAAVPTFSASTAFADTDIALIALVRKLNAASQALDQAAVIGSPPLDGSSEWPTASTAGVPAGVSLKTVNGVFTSSSNGQVIEGLDIGVAIIVNHTGVTVRNCRVTGGFDVKAVNCIVEYCDLYGIGFLPGADGSTIRYCDISNVENGIWAEANNVLIENNYIHDLAGGSEAHIDGIQFPQVTPAIHDVIIRNNNINLGSSTTTSCITMTGCNAITVDHNRVCGGAYVIYFEYCTDNRLTNNTFRLGPGSFGYFDHRGSKYVSSGNIDEVTGRRLNL